MTQAKLRTRVRDLEAKLIEVHALSVGALLQLAGTVHIEALRQIEIATVGVAERVHRKKTAGMRSVATRRARVDRERQLEASPLRVEV